MSPAMAASVARRVPCPTASSSPPSASRLPRSNAKSAAALHARPLSLTPTGERLFAHVRPFFEPLAALLAELQQPPTPHLRIGASEVVMSEYMPGVIAALRAREPALRFTLVAHPTPDLLRALEAGTLDLVVGALRPLAPGLAARRLLQLRWCCSPQGTAASAG